MAKYSTEQIKQMIIAEAKKQGVDPNLALAVAKQESSFNPNARNVNKGDRGVDEGVFQINNKWHKLKNPYDPVENISYGIKHLKGLLAGARGDVRKALSDYNAGAGAKGTGRKQGDAYAQKVMALMNKQDGNITGAAAPIPAQNADLSVADNMADLYEAQISDAERLARIYFLTKGYDDTYFQKLKKEADEKIAKTREELKKIETSASPDKIREITGRMDAAKAEYDKDMNLAVDAAKQGIPTEKINKYVNMFKNTTEENINRLKQANPYTQMAQKAPLNLDDYANALNRQQQTNAMIRANNIAMGGQAEAVDFGNEAMQLAQARQAAEMARQTGLTPEQFIAGANMDYQAMGTALNNQQQLEAQLYNQAVNGDIDAYNKLVQLYSTRATNNLTNANTLTGQLQQEDINALRRAELQSQNERDMLGKELSLNPAAVSADAAMQQSRQSQAGATIRQGMSGGNQAAGNYLNYMGMLQKAAADGGSENDPYKAVKDFYTLQANLYGQNPQVTPAQLKDLSEEARASIVRANPAAFNALYPEFQNSQQLNNQPANYSQWQNNFVNTFENKNNPRGF